MASVGTADVAGACEDQHESDLYGDLDLAAPLAKRSKASAAPRASSLSDSLRCSSAPAAPPDGTLRAGGRMVYEADHVEKLRREIESLKTENETLKRNMGTLYRTARAELDRKDATIARLQEQLDGGQMA